MRCMTRAELPAAEARCAKAMIEPDGDCDLCGGSEEVQYIRRDTETFDQTACPCSQIAVRDDRDRLRNLAADLPRALVGNRAYVELVERIEQKIAVCETAGALIQTAEDFRALLAPPKEK